MFAVIILFAGTYFCGSLEKSQKSQNLEPAKISCDTVFFFSFTVVPVFLLWLRVLMLRKVEMKINEKQTGSGKDRLRCCKKKLVFFECVLRLIISFKKSFNLTCCTLKAT